MALGSWALLLVGALPERLEDPSAFAAKQPAELFSAEGPQAEQRWRDALARARVFLPAPEALSPLPAELACRLHPRPARGSTRKFYCVLAGGETVKVKYGEGNPEVPSELASARLLEAAGFGADPVQLLQRVRCFGCDADPFELHQCWRRQVRPKAWEQKPESCPEPSYERFTDFEHVLVERRGREPHLPDGKRAKAGWLGIDQLGAAGEAERDALRLMLVFLQHWDDGPDNQRLVCAEVQRDPAGQVSGCRRARWVLQDAGASFGSWRAAFDPLPGVASVPARMRLESWRAEPMFIDRRRCIVHRPRGRRREADGAPASPQTLVVKEAGRRLFAERVAPLDRAALLRIFREAAVEPLGFGSAESWASVAAAKLDQLRAARCPK